MRRFNPLSSAIPVLSGAIDASRAKTAGFDSAWSSEVSGPIETLVRDLVREPGDFESALRSFAIRLMPAFDARWPSEGFSVSPASASRIDKDTSIEKITRRVALEIAREIGNLDLDDDPAAARDRGALHALALADLSSDERARAKVKAMEIAGARASESPKIRTIIEMMGSLCLFLEKHHDDPRVMRLLARIASRGGDDGDLCALYGALGTFMKEKVARDPAHERAIDVFVEGVNELSKKKKHDPMFERLIESILGSPLIELFRDDERRGAALRVMLDDDEESMKLVEVLRAVGRMDERRRRAVDRILRHLADKARDQIKDPSARDLADVVRAETERIRTRMEATIDHGQTPTTTLLDDPRLAMMQHGAWIVRGAEQGRASAETEVDAEGFDKLTADPNRVRFLARGLADRVAERTVARIVERDQFFVPRLGEEEALRNSAECLVAAGIRWARSGLPTVVPTHRLAASMMAMSIAPDAARDVRLPWRTFCILLPDALLPEDGPIAGARAIWVTESDDERGKKHAAIAFRAPQPGREGRKFHEAVLLFEFDDGADLAAVSSRDEANRPIVELVAMFVLGVAIEMDQAVHREAIDAGPPSPSRKGKRREGDEPRAWTFALRRDVKMDMRQWVRDTAASGRRAGPSVQVLVRGHHKRQVFGKGRSDRKWIYVECYWRGPEDAPIAVRQHTMSDAASEPNAEKDG